MQSLRISHPIKQTLGLRNTIVTITLHYRDERLLPYDPRVAISDMAINVGKQLKVCSELVLFCDQKQL